MFGSCVCPFFLSFLPYIVKLLLSLVCGEINLLYTQGKTALEQVVLVLVTVSSNYWQKHWTRARMSLLITSSHLRRCWITCIRRTLYATCNVRYSRCNLPVIASVYDRMACGESKWWTWNSIGYEKWKDSKIVHVMCTAFGPNTILNARRTQKDGTSALVECPQSVVEYTKRMGGVDRFDRSRGHYSVSYRAHGFAFLLLARRILRSLSKARSSRGTAVELSLTWKLFNTFMNLFLDN